MKKLYFILPLWILLALPFFVQNSIFQANNQLDIYEQLQQHKSDKEKKGHRGSGRRYNSLVLK